MNDVIYENEEQWKAGIIKTIKTNYDSKVLIFIHDIPLKKHHDTIDWLEAENFNTSYHHQNTEAAYNLEKDLIESYRLKKN